MQRYAYEVLDSIINHGTVKPSTERRRGRPRMYSMEERIARGEELSIPFTEKDIAGRLDMDSSLVTRGINQLADLGVVERRPKAEDKRAREIIIPDADFYAWVLVRKVAQSIPIIRPRQLPQVLFSDVPATETKQIRMVSYRQIDHSVINNAVEALNDSHIQLVSTAEDAKKSFDSGANAVTFSDPYIDQHSDLKELPRIVMQGNKSDCALLSRVYPSDEIAFAEGAYLDAQAAGSIRSWSRNVTKPLLPDKMIRVPAGELYSMGASENPEMNLIVKPSDALILAFLNSEFHYGGEFPPQGRSMLLKPDNYNWTTVQALVNQILETADQASSQRFRYITVLKYIQGIAQVLPRLRDFVPDVMLGPFMTETYE